MIKSEDDVAHIAADHGVSENAARHLLDALVRGGGSQAQFNHPDLGGMGQWQGGMLMIGDMFNDGLKARIAVLLKALAPMAEQMSARDPGAQSTDRPSDRNWWPEGLGVPASTGAQNDMRYAVFPSSRRLVLEEGGNLVIYDTGDHRISGVSQQQAESRSLRFQSQLGTFGVAELTRVE